MNISEEEEIKKEFQLERVVLFSDAVFAIIITIMVLEMKLPEGLRRAGNEEIHHALMELLPKFAGYMLSYFIVGVFWAKHLKLFSYLKDYTKTLIILNLAFLFFISLFPFTVSILTETLTPHNFDGLFIYFGVVLLALMTQTALTGYLVRNAQTLCINPGEVANRLEWKAQRLNFILIPLLFAYTIAGKVYQFSPTFFSYGFLVWAALMGFIRKKFYPKSQDEGPAAGAVICIAEEEEVGFKNPSPGRGGMNCVVAGRGLAIKAGMANWLDPFLHLPKGRNLTSSRSGNSSTPPSKTKYSSSTLQTWCA